MHTTGGITHEISQRDQSIENTGDLASDLVGQAVVDIIETNYLGVDRVRDLAGPDQVLPIDKTAACLGAVGRHHDPADLSIPIGICDADEFELLPQCAVGTVGIACHAASLPRIPEAGNAF